MESKESEYVTDMIKTALEYLGEATVAIRHAKEFAETPRYKVSLTFAQERLERLKSQLKRLVGEIRY